MAKKTAVVWGYFLENLGDDLMLKSFLNVAKGKYDRIYINSFKKFETFYSRLGVTVVKQDSFFQRAINRVLRQLGRPQLYFRLASRKNTDFIILGGSLFIESQDQKNDLQRITDLEYAVEHGDCSYVIGSNFGPYSSNWYMEKLRRIFEKCADVCFRDQYSWELFSDLKNTRYAPDVVLSGLWEGEKDKICQSDRILISVIDLQTRPKLRGAASRYEKLLAGIAMYHVAQGDRVGLISFCEQDGDHAVCERVKRACNCEKIEIIEYRDFGILSVISQAKKIYGSRFHSIILSLYYGIQYFPFVYDQKTVNALATYCGTGDFVDVRDTIDVRDVVEMQSGPSLMDGVKESAKRQFLGISQHIG